MHWKSPWCWERLKAGGKGTTEDEMAGWHHWLYGDEFEPTLGESEGQGSLACCSPWGAKSQTWLSDWTTTKVVLTVSMQAKTGSLVWFTILILPSTSVFVGGGSHTKNCCEGQARNRTRSNWKAKGNRDWWRLWLNRQPSVWTKNTQVQTVYSPEDIHLWATTCKLCTND